MIELQVFSINRLRSLLQRNLFLLYLLSTIPIFSNAVIPKIKICILVLA